ncbi:hypothetical protein ABXJ76_15085 [Methylobacter sp. G7]|uniref:hypothetical protein n=1 Tax=Methylobacter sp. G7 TaxID=3230117 RepID=UPI003D805D6C
MIATAANALTELFEHAKDTLSDEKLDWLAGLDSVAECESTNISMTLINLAIAQGSEDRSTLPNSSQLAAILFGLSAQVEMMSALSSVSSEAAYILAQKAKSQA